MLLIFPFSRLKQSASKQSNSLMVDGKLKSWQLVTERKYHSVTCFASLVNLPSEMLPLPHSPNIDTLPNISIKANCIFDIGFVFFKISQISVMDNIYIYIDALE